MVPFWLILNAMGHFRVPANVETIGLDDSYHGGSAYPGGPEEETDKSLRGAAAAKQANGGGMAGGGASRVRPVACQQVRRAVARSVFAAALQHRSARSGRWRHAAVASCGHLAGFQVW